MRNKIVATCMLLLLLLSTVWWISRVEATETVLTLSDIELSTQFAKNWGPGTVTAIVDIAGPGVRFDFTGLNTTSGTGVSDDYSVSRFAGGAPDGIGGWGDFSGYTQYSLVFTNVGAQGVSINV